MIRAAAISLIACALILAVWPVRAQTHGPVMMRGGIICDTVEQVIAFIDDPAGAPPEGCGKLVQPLPGMVTILGVYEANGRRFKLARFDFLVPVPFGSQFGIGGPPEEIKADVEA